MGYSIYIGEARIEQPTAEDFKKYNCRYLSIKVDEVRSKLAPVFPGDDLTGDSNSRSPSYTGWADFARDTGLHGFFFDAEVGLMSSHPGTVRLFPEHGEQIRSALKAYRQRYPYTKPGWCACVGCGGFGGEDTPHNDTFELGPSGNLARLMWLDFWVTWALANCQIPTLYNS